MKIFISADMEGISGVCSWEDVNPENPLYSKAQIQMTHEVIAACEGAIEAGAKEIWVRDAHWSAKNLLIEQFPKGIHFIRGWSKHPYLMVQGIDSTFDAAVFVGYHSPAGSSKNPLAHTIETQLNWIKVNGAALSEFQLYGGAAALEKVPVVFLSGDQGICEIARQMNSKIHTIPIVNGIGASTVSTHPLDAVSKIKEGVSQTLKSPDLKSIPTLEQKGPFTLELCYKLPADAYRFSFYPGATLTGENTVSFQTSHWFEVLRAVLFLT